MKELFTWVEAFFAVNPNTRSHTLGAMHMGYGMIHCRSREQKLNTQITTESELVGTSEYVLFNILMVVFYESQVYDITKDNISRQ